ncbi:hypothetical protein GH5_08338 [Leishmania sp. Ghana 2012 LV757]|uniref:hypothetical protein n=1 Tax=Leishmania sp. Ghana 2012 LV757 TaxID=2803181 RepID=UPI001B729D5F|nr:hypothetical protein GH5_08338 [Leishmania sp. Ghana 2012 LV757]
MASATDSGHAPFSPSLPFQLPLGPVLLVIQGTAIDLNLARGTPRAVPQLSSGYGITPSSSTPSWAGGKTMILATSTVTTTTATTIATVAGGGTELLHSSLRHLRMLASNAAEN